MLFLFPVTVKLVYNHQKPFIKLMANDFVCIYPLSTFVSGAGIKYLLFFFKKPYHAFIFISSTSL